MSSREAEQEYTAEPGGTAEKVLERAGDIRDRHKAKQAAKDAGDVVTEAGEALHRPSSRLQFTAAERADPRLSKYVRKAEKQADKLDAAKDALPKKRVVTKETVYDEASGRARTKLRFDKVEKPAPQLKPNPMSRPVQEPTNLTVSNGIFRKPRPRSRSCKSSFGSWKRQRPNRKICRSSSLCGA